jgi:hypothetical protein
MSNHSRVVDMIAPVTYTFHYYPITVTNIAIGISIAGRRQSRQSRQKEPTCLHYECRPR